MPTIINPLPTNDGYTCHETFSFMIVHSAMPFQDGGTVGDRGRWVDVPEGCTQHSHVWACLWKGLGWSQVGHFSWFWCKQAQKTDTSSVKADFFSKESVRTFLACWSNTLLISGCPLCLELKVQGFFSADQQGMLVGSNPLYYCNLSIVSQVPLPPPHKALPPLNKRRERSQKWLTPRSSYTSVSRSHDDCEMIMWLSRDPV